MLRGKEQIKGGKKRGTGQRKAAMERLSQTKKRNTEGKTSGVHAKKSTRGSSDVVEYLKQKREHKSDHQKEEMQLRREELEASFEQQSQQNDMMKKFMEQQHQQTQMLLSLLVQKKYITGTNLKNIAVLRFFLCFLYFLYC